MTDDAAPRFSLVVLGGVPSPAATGRASSLAVGDPNGPFEWVPCAGDDPSARRDALARARGEFVGFVEGSARLHRDAFDELAAGTATADVDVVYTNEDVLDGDIHRDPFLKPGWSPERLLAQSYLGRLTLFRTDRANQAAAACSAPGVAFEHELALRVTGSARRIVHVDRILYHRAGGDTASGTRATADPAAGARAVNAVLEERGAPLRVEPGTVPDTFRVLPRLAREPLVSIVIPTRGTTRRVRGRPVVLVEHCITTLLERSQHRNLEIVVVADTSTPASTREMLDSVADRGVRTVEYTHAFNFSEKINTGVVESRGEHLVLLNDDIEITEPAWIGTLLAFAELEGVGAVGPQLRFEDGRLQHVGVVLADGGAGHPYYGYPHDTAGYFGTPHVTANYLAVTAACLMTRRDCFEQVGGLSPAFPVNYNDVDYCLKLHRQGLRVVYTPEVVLSHYESSSRGPAAPRPEELELLRRRWGSLCFADPYYSPRFVPGGNFVTAIRADGRPLDDPTESYRAVLARRIRAAARRPRSRS